MSPALAPQSREHPPARTPWRTLRTAASDREGTRALRASSTGAWRAPDRSAKAGPHRQAGRAWVISFRRSPRSAAALNRRRSTRAHHFPKARRIETALSKLSKPHSTRRAVGTSAHSRNPAGARRGVLPQLAFELPSTAPRRASERNLRAHGSRPCRRVIHDRSSADRTRHPTLH